MFDKIEEASLLYDFYGKLLTEKQRNVMDLYHEEDCSLSEIADEFGISRQAVHIALKNAEKSLIEYESKLGLIKRFSESSVALDEIDKKLDDLINESKGDKRLVEKLVEIKAIIDNLEI